MDRALRCHVTAALASGCLLACDGRDRQDGSSSEFPADVCSELPFPSHPRPAAAAARVRPELEASLHRVGLRFGDPVFLRAYKRERLLEVFVKGREDGKFRLFRSYPIAGASGELGPKLREGDRQVPEGFYLVSAAAMNPESRFHLSFNIGYPNALDRFHGRTGSLIMIHGGRASIGCLAMTDPGIEEIYLLCDAALRGGQEAFPVHLFPFRMTDENLAAMAGHPWRGFWDNLREGHGWFENRRVPPATTVTHDGKYEFREP